MDINEFRGLITIITLATFIGICAWAYASHNRQRFDEDAMLPFADVDDEVLRSQEAASHHE